MNDLFEKSLIKVICLNLLDFISTIQTSFHLFFPGMKSSQSKSSVKATAKNNECKSNNAEPYGSLSHPLRRHSRPDHCSAG